MKKFKQKRLAKAVLALCLVLTFASFAAVSGFAADLNMGSRMNNKTAETTDPPPIGEGIVDGAKNMLDGIKNGAKGIVNGAKNGARNIIDGAEDIADRVESDMFGGFETNIPDKDIGGAFKDRDKDGVSDPTDSDDDNDGVLDKRDRDADNDGIEDSRDRDPDGDGVDERKMSGTLMGIGIAVLIIAGVAVLAYALMPKKKSR